MTIALKKNGKKVMIIIGTFLIFSVKHLCKL